MKSTSVCIFLQAGFWSRIHLGSKMEVLWYCGTLVNFRRITWLYVAEDRSLHVPLFPVWNLLEMHVEDYSDTQLQAWSKSLLKAGWYKQIRNSISFFSSVYFKKAPGWDRALQLHSEARGRRTMLDSARRLTLLCCRIALRLQAHVSLPKHFYLAKVIMWFSAIIQMNIYMNYGRSMPIEDPKINWHSCALYGG